MEKPYLIRMKQERSELSERISKLAEFTNTPEALDMPWGSRILLLEQLKHMSAYLLVLDKRIYWD
ncbi:hypothetical protein HBM09_004283 [Vibrio parahaemolyticus]